MRSSIQKTGYYYQQSDGDIATAVLREKRFYGIHTLHVLPDNPYIGLAKTIAEPSNIGLKNKIIEEIGKACTTEQAHHVLGRKEIIAKLRKAAS